MEAKNDIEKLREKTERLKNLTLNDKYWELQEYKDLCREITGLQVLIRNKERLIRKQEVVDKKIMFFIKITERILDTIFFIPNIILSHGGKSNK